MLDIFADRAIQLVSAIMLYENVDFKTSSDCFFVLFVCVEA